MPPTGRASGPTTRTWPPAAGTPPLDPGDSGMPGRAPRPIAHRRQPDRVRLVQVVRPVGRSTWTRRTRPGRAKLARRDASTAGSEPSFGRNLGDDLAKCHRQHCPRPTLTNTLTRTWSQTLRSAVHPDLVRDEEAVGSNP